MPLLEVAVAEGNLAGIAGIGVGHSSLNLDAIAAEGAPSAGRDGCHGFVCEDISGLWLCSSRGRRERRKRGSTRDAMGAGCGRTERGTQAKEKLFGYVSSWETVQCRGVGWRGMAALNTKCPAIRWDMRVDVKSIFGGGFWLPAQGLAFALWWGSQYYAGGASQPVSQGPKTHWLAKSWRRHISNANTSTGALDLAPLPHARDWWIQHRHEIETRIAECLNLKMNAEFCSATPNSTAQRVLLSRFPGIITLSLQEKPRSRLTWKVYSRQA